MTENEGYLIDLLRLEQGQSEFQFTLDNQYFQSIDKSEVVEGEVSVKAVLDIAEHTMHLDLDLSGTVTLVCDRCLDLMDYPVELGKSFDVVFSENDEEDEDVVCVSRAFGKVDAAWLSYEQIIVNLPLVHRHQEGECNPLMEELLLAHQAPSE